MGFEQDLRDYLHGLGQVESSPIDEADLRSHLLARLREREQDPSWVRRTHDKWASKIGHFVRYLAALSLDLAPADRGGPRAFARRVLDAAIGFEDAGVSLVESLELQRVASGFRPVGAAVEAYALETRLTATKSASAFVQTTPLAAAFLRLRGREAIRWLLTLEVVQSTGRGDPWRVPDAILAKAMTEGGFDTWASEETLERMCALQALSESTTMMRTKRYDVPKTMRGVVKAVIEAGPWHAAIRALLEDERASVFPGSRANASEATIEQTRLIVHEIRNALVPVRVRLDTLLSPGSAAPLQPNIEGARRGVVRVLDFVEQMLETSELVSEQTGAHDLATIVREAIRRVDDDDRVEMIEAAPVRVQAQRRPLVIAISNLIHNALQAAGPSKPVRATVTLDLRKARVEVDDGGPGVPEVDRTRVFDDGFTTRPGGSGYGLAYVKRAVERTVHGKVWCERSDLGGARFVIELPADPIS